MKSYFKSPILAQRSYFKSAILTSVLTLQESKDYEDVINELMDIWLDDYYSKTPRHHVVETKSDGFSYLFDVQNARLIAAWGISKGPQHNKRDKSRMAGHPMETPHYHRGHAIPHTLGGGTDINLVTQKGSLNIGPFRALENRAVNTPGALYFTYWVYLPVTNRHASVEQLPSEVDQGLLVNGDRAEIRSFMN